eukprot:2888392-Pyramimonas_sp.AAC.1
MNILLPLAQRRTAGELNMPSRWAFGCATLLIKKHLCPQPLLHFLEKRLNLRYPELGVTGGHMVPAHRWVHIIKYLRGCSMPWAFADIKTVANGWATSHMILQPHGRLSCRFGCLREPDA